MTIAVITPAYVTEENGRLEFLRQTMRSVLAQSYRDFVYLLVDDGSPIDLEYFTGGLHDFRVRYVRRNRQPTDLKTSANAINAGIDSALSGYMLTRQEVADLAAVTFLHSDDLLTQNSLITRLVSLPTGFVHTDIAHFDNRGKVRAIYKQPRVYKLYNPHTMMWNVGFLRYLKDFVSERYGQSGIFDSNLACAEDRDMCISSGEAAAEGNFGITYILNVSVLYRVHERSITGTLEKDDNDETQKRILEKHGIKPVSENVSRMNSNPPWSWFTLLPEGMKKPLRPVRDTLSGQRPQFLELEKQLQQFV